MGVIHDVEQGSEEWFLLRSKRMTASHAQAIAANGKGLITYIHGMMSAHYSKAEKEVYSNAHTERGIELEPIARQIYEMEEGVQVEEVGFVSLDEYVGCSPDGVVGKGLGEFKCPSDPVYFKRLIGDDSIDSGYIWQMQMQMFIMGKEWCDYVEYNPNYKTSLWVKRIEVDIQKVEKLVKGIDAGRNMIIDIQKKYNEANASV